MPSSSLPSPRPDDAASAAAPAANRYAQAWFQRVREVDDGTVALLCRSLVQMRRIKRALSSAGFVAGAFLFGAPNLDHGIYSLLIYGTLSCAIGFPVMAASTLAVRLRLIAEAKRHGLTTSAALLLMTRAERCARHLSITLGADEATAALVEAVREPDRP